MADAAIRSINQAREMAAEECEREIDFLDERDRERKRKGLPRWSEYEKERRMLKERITQLREPVVGG